MNFFQTALVMNNGVTIENILTGTDISQIPAGEGSLVSIAAASSDGDHSISAWLGTNQLVEDAQPNVVSRGSAKVPRDLLVDDEPAMPGETLRVSVTNTATGSGQGTIYVRVNVEPA